MTLQPNNFLALAATSAILLLAIQPLSSFEISEATVDSIQKAYKAKTLNATTLVSLYLKRIELFNPILKCVLEVNPDALLVAGQKDAERAAAAGGYIGGLHGIPVLLKDNIATRDKLNTTAGSYALLYSIVKKDASAVTRLRNAGAIILGKASMSEWANFRSSFSISGWSARGGFTLSPYNLQSNPSGSSSGSAVCAAANLAAITVGSETDGSIISPSELNSVVGLKPTVGLISRAGVIPISSSQDTLGPICRTVSDAVHLLDVLYARSIDSRDSKTSRCLSAIPKAGYLQFLNVTAVKGKRVGVIRELFSPGLIPSYTIATFQSHLKKLRDLGAVLVNISLPGLLDNVFGPDELTVLLYDFKAELAAYLSSLEYAPSGRTLSSIIAFNKYDPRELIGQFDQGVFLAAQDTTGRNATEYKKAKARVASITNAYFQQPLKKYKLDAYVGPAGLGLGSVAAQGGFPVITVPAGYAAARVADPEDTPFGLAFFGAECSEPTLIQLAYAFERATKVRKVPQFKGVPPEYVFQ